MLASTGRKLLVVGHECVQFACVEAGKPIPESRYRPAIYTR
jgi:hypothetical protein